MEYLGILIGPLSLAAGILLLLIVITGFFWIVGKIEAYDPVNAVAGHNLSCFRSACFRIGCQTVA